MSYGAIVKVGRLAETRCGLITAEWLNEAGLSASQKTALVKSGYLERVTRGVYKVAGAPSTRFTEILALWMRLGDNDYTSDPPVLVAAGATAAYLHDIGDMWPDPYDFITSRPLRTREPGVVLRHETVDPRDVEVVEGIPCLSPVATLVDLIKDHGDLSLVGDAVVDARTRNYLNAHTEPDFVRRLGPLAAENDLPEGEGEKLLELITQYHQGVA